MGKCGRGLEKSAEPTEREILTESKARRRKRTEVRERERERERTRCAREIKKETKEGLKQQAEETEKRNRERRSEV